MKSRTHAEREAMERYFVRRLSEEGADVSQIDLGSTTFEIRRDRIGELIVENELASIIIGKFGHRRTFAALFVEFYETELQISKPVT